MTSVRFVGDLSLWVGLATALAVCAMSWRYYRRESFDLPQHLRWLLPLLRSLAFMLGVMMLTGPVLHHRKVIGELGHVRIYIDASQSMGLRDRHIAPGRKLLIAQQQGWIEQGRIDDRLLNLANELTEVRRAASSGLQAADTSSEHVERLRTDLLSSLQSIHRRLPVDDESETRFAGEFVQTLILPLDDVTAATPVDDVVNQLNAVQAAMRVFEARLHAAFDDDVQHLIDSGDASIHAALTMFDESSRWARAERTLLETPDALFADLKRHHHVEVFALHDQQAVELLDGLSMAEPAAEFSQTPDAATTDLTSGITSSQTAAVRSESDTVQSDSAQPSGKANTAVVLLTDGQHNSGPSPLQMARILGEQGTAVYPVSLGAAQPAPDLAVTGLEHPQAVFQRDRVRGTMIVRDLMPAGQPLVAEIVHAGEILWQQQLVTENSGQRRIDFEFGIDELVERQAGQLAADVKQHAVTLALTARIAPLQHEAEPDNNQRMIRLAAITQNNRLLIVDGRARWETRYLRNAFQRDPQWDVNVIIAGPGTDDETLPRGDSQGLFPETRDALFEYDLIIVGEVAPELFADHEYQWIREFVETRGGGMVFIDGQRGRLRQQTEQSLRSLLPIEWQPDSAAGQPSRLQLTQRGAREPAFMLEADSVANQRFWNELPAPHTLSDVDVLPGGEVLAEAVVDGSPRPAIVTRHYGAGRVLYLAFDETWRWRYKAADTYHRRIWNQLATYVMPRPFAVSDDYLSIDTGPVSYPSGESVDIRIRLTGLDGQPATDATVDALVWKDGHVVSTVSLLPDADVPGIYRGRTGALSDGDYEVSIQASGFSQQALKARGQFVVLPPESGELESTACNEPLLQQMAADSGGVYLREEQVHQLADLLSPLSNGRVVESDTLLWQSYWWFAAMMILLTLEWFLRKRAGLL